MFISFEGIDGSGKGTQVSLFLSYLERQGLPFVRVREPGGTELGEAIRKLLLAKEEISICPRAELFLFLASRSQLVSEIVLPALRENKIVVADRFIDSSVAYQGAARKLGTKIVEELNDFATCGLKPDLTYYIDITPETALRRKRGSDRIESEGIKFLAAVREAYLNLLEQHSNRIVLINGERSVDEIHQEIIRIFEDFSRRKK
ncbi:MAG: dTMP kinase [Pseudothermotoga sp.]